MALVLIHEILFKTLTFKNTTKLRDNGFVQIIEKFPLSKVLLESIRNAV